jgi:surface antigen
MFGKKATVGALGGAAAGAYLGGGDPLASAGYAVVGMVLGHTVGDHFDKVDHIYGTMLIKQSLNHNPDGVSSTWKNPNKNVVVTNTPIATNGTCREFITDVQVSNKMRKMRGTACKHNGVWELKELYK